jgi:hypothetical protein
MSSRESVDPITEENWQTAITPRCHAGMWMGAYLDRDEDGFFGVWGKPGTWGFTVRCESLAAALAWVNRDPQPFSTIEFVLPDIQTDEEPSAESRST